MPKRPRGTGRIYQRGKIWWIKYHDHGVPKWESSESEIRKDAEKLLAKRLGQVASGRGDSSKAERLTVFDLCRMVLEDYKTRELRSASIVGWRMQKHLAHRFSKTRAADFRERDVKRYIAERKAEESARGRTAVATINRELAIIRRGYALAVRSGLIDRAPFIEKLEEDNVRQGFLEHESYLRLRAALPVYLKCLLVVLYHLGCRLGELRKLRWDQVDLAACEIRFPGSDTKSKKPRTAPIYGEMIHWLEMQKAERDDKWPACPWVFHRFGKPIGDHVRGWNEACDVADIPKTLRHDLRRTAIRNMERAGIPRSIAMSISGHRTEAVFRRYDIVSKKDLGLAAERMEQYLNKVGDTCGDSREQAQKRPT